MNPPIRIMVVDDHPVVRKGIVAMLETEQDLHVVAECHDGKEAVDQVEVLKPDVILMDLVMPGMDGIAAIREIKKRYPGSHILVLTSFSTTDMVFPSLNAGATGYLLKDSDPGELIKAIRQVQRGEGSLHPAITKQVLNQLSQPAEDKTSPFEDLTERELEVLRHVAEGLSNQEIAELLVVSEATVHSHVSKILSKLNLTSRTQAALLALRKGLVPFESDSE